MSRLENIDTTDLQEWLDHVESKAATQWVMLALTHKRGIAVTDLSDWYGISEQEITDWFEELESTPLIIAVAEKEGIDIEELAKQYGMSPRTIRDWFQGLASDSPEQAIDLITRYSQQQSVPVFRQTQSRVQYLDHAVIAENRWSVDDEDLFEKASRADLDPEEYGRILVEPGESILEAAEGRGYSWPYACRGGACANCAVLVIEGDIAMPGQNVLTDEQVNVMNARLTCVGVPVTDEVKIVMNVQHLDQFSDLRLPSPLGESE